MFLFHGYQAWKCVIITRWLSQLPITLPLPRVTETLNFFSEMFDELWHQFGTCLNRLAVLTNMWYQTVCANIFLVEGPWRSSSMLANVSADEMSIRYSGVSTLKFVVHNRDSLFCQCTGICPPHKSLSKLQCHLETAEWRLFTSLQRLDVANNV